MFAHLKAICIAALALLLSSCWIPEKFTASVSVNKDGSYAFTYDGILANGLALASEAQGKLSAKDELGLKNDAEKLRKEPGFKSVSYLGKGRYQVKVEIAKKAGERYAFVADGNAKLFSVQPQKDGTINISSFEIDKKALANLKQINAKVQGELKVTVASGVEVVKHNADSSPMLKGLFGSYSWHIKTVDAAPYIVVRPVP